MRLRTARFALALVRVLFILALAPAIVKAGPTPAQAPAEAEINFLLTAIGASGCEFYRNGSWYTSQKAQAHLTDKYQWLSARHRVKTAEDFIELAATRSSMSGQAYAVRCAGEAPVSSNSWLTEQLRRYRDDAGAPPAGHEASAAHSPN